MATKKFITDENLKYYSGLVKAEIAKKIAKGGLKTINGQSLEGSGNIELDFTVAEIVTALPEITKASKSKIYLVPSGATETNNSYAEYIKVTVSGTDKWEKIGEYKADVALTWRAISDKPSTFTPSAHTHNKSEVGLGNVDNTSDANKPVSTAQKAALDKKMNLDDVPTDTITNVVVEKATATAVQLGVYKRSKKEVLGSVGFSDSGTQINIPAATASTAGVMTGDDKSHLDTIFNDYIKSADFAELSNTDIATLWNNA